MARAAVTSDLEHAVARSAAVPDLDVVREMIRTMETLTLAGQRHTMARIVAFIDQRATRCERTIGIHNRNMLEQLLEELTRESRRIFPDVRSFGSRAEALLGLLAAAQP